MLNCLCLPLKKNNFKLYSWYRVISNLCILDRYSKYVKNSATNKKHLYTEDNLAGISHVIRYEEVPLYSYPQMYYFCDTWSLNPVLTFVYMCNSVVYIPL